MVAHGAPLLPLRDIVVFPQRVVPLFVGRDRSIAAVDAADIESRQILLAAQRRAKTHDPEPEDIFEYGTLATIIQPLRLPDGTVKVLVEGKERVQIESFLCTEPFFRATYRVLPSDDQAHVPIELEAGVRSLKRTFETYVKMNKRLPIDTLSIVNELDNPSHLSDLIAGYLTLRLEDKQELLEITSSERRLHRVHELMQAEIDILQVERKIRTRVKKQMERSQKEYYLNEQMQAIQKELGDRDEIKSDFQELEERIVERDLPEEARMRAYSELKKLKLMPPMAAEASVVRNYIEWILALPWETVTEDQLDLESAESILDADHFGLEKVKERIVEYLAVRVLVEEPQGPILCLVGPPGVGKTSLARSVARALDRKFVRMSLGGVRDEAEIRGHRRTYVGSMPGKILQNLKKAQSGNPVFLLDEVDKLSSDHRGDPSSALLEVLDPEQNDTFSDHYLDLDYDLSRVLFLATANTTSTIPPALLDRLEIIELDGYTDLEKLAIARRYLIPKQRKMNGVDGIDLHFTQPALRQLIRRYTREAGVRALEREIGSICRKAATQLVKSPEFTELKVTEKKVEQLLGKPKFRKDQSEREDEIGLATGLAWTQTGGAVLFTEVTLVPGKGKLILTGKLGEVMRESAQAAVTYVRARTDLLGIDRDFYSKVDVHIHIPDGAIPKDGPSAGVTLVTALVSSLTGVAVKSSVAMTGEITLRGRVLPIGGLKEKVLAAHRIGIREVLVPSDNVREIDDVPKSVLQQVQITLVERIDEVLVAALALRDPEQFSLRMQGAFSPAAPTRH